MTHETGLCVYLAKFVGYFNTPKLGHHREVVARSQACNRQSMDTRAPHIYSCARDWETIWQMQRLKHAVSCKRCNPTENRTAHALPPLRRTTGSNIETIDLACHNPTRGHRSKMCSDHLPSPTCTSRVFPSLHTECPPGVQVPLEERAEVGRGTFAKQCRANTVGGCESSCAGMSGHVCIKPISLIHQGANYIRASLDNALGLNNICWPLYQNNCVPESRNCQPAAGWRARVRVNLHRCLAHASHKYSPQPIVLLGHPPQMCQRPSLRMLSRRAAR